MCMIVHMLLPFSEPTPELRPNTRPPRSPMPALPARDPGREGGMRDRRSSTSSPEVPCREILAEALKDTLQRVPIVRDAEWAGYEIS